MMFDPIKSMYSNAGIQQLLAKPRTLIVSRPMLDINEQLRGKVVR